MFDLNDSIANWRSRLAHDESCTAADLSELESHLREQVDALRGSGLSEEEAFWVAGRRLGDAASLSVEFAKVNEGRVWANRLLWMMGGILISILASSLAGAAWWGTLFAGSHLGMSGTVLGTAAAVARTLAWFISVGIVCAVVYFAAARSPRMPNSFRVSLPVLSGAVLLLVFGATAIRIVSPAVTLRAMDTAAYAKAALIGGYAQLAWSFAFPALVVATILVLWRKQARAPHASTHNSSSGS
jgi:uncharacterized membrane protein